MVQSSTNRVSDPNSLTPQSLLRRLDIDLFRPVFLNTRQSNVQHTIVKGGFDLVPPDLEGQLESARKALERAVELSSGPTDFQGELVALELRNALDHLGAISGQVVTEDILAEIFSRFCIGK